jgi:hypothetical protein
MVILPLSDIRHAVFGACQCGVGYELGVLVCGNGVRQYKLRCPNCRHKPPMAVSHKLLTEAERTTAEIWQVNGA